MIESYDEIVILDIEASGLDFESYPIEIAYSDISGTVTDTFVINPLSASNWDHWSTESESVHGIQRQELIKKGISVKQAAERLNQVLSVYTVLSDNVVYDWGWLERLFKAADEYPQFGVFSLQDELQISIPFDMERKHRAIDDVKQLISIIKKLV